MTTIICQATACMYNTEERCRCHAIGIELKILEGNGVEHQGRQTRRLAACDTYMVLPDEICDRLKGQPCGKS